MSLKALKSLQLMFIVSIHDIPLWFLCRTCIRLFPGCCWIWLAEARAGWCHIFHGLNRQNPSTDVKYIWADICNSAYLGLFDDGQVTNWFAIYQIPTPPWYVIVSLKYFGAIAGKNTQDSILRHADYKGEYHNEDSSWRCDCVHVVSAEVTVNQVRQTLAKTNDATAMTWEIRTFSVNTTETMRCQMTMTLSC